VAEQENWPNIYIDNGDGGVGSLADPYNALSDINWTTGGDNSIFDYYDNSPTASVTINLKKGGEWRELLTSGADGTDTYRVQVRAYSDGDMPIISGSTLRDDWEISGTANIYKIIGISVRPQQFFLDDVSGYRQVADDLSKNLDWIWDRDGEYYDTTVNTVYLYCDTGDPDDEYTKIESSARAFCIDFNGSYLTIDGIRTRYCNRNGMGGNEPGSYITIKNCIAEWCWYKGIGPDGQPSGAFNHWIIEDNIVRYNGIGGIGLNECAGESIIRRNQVYENAVAPYAQEIFEPPMNFAWGIKCFEQDQDPGMVGTEIYDNHVHSNGRDMVTEGSAVGIWHDHILGDTNNRNTIHHNLIHDNTGNGVFIEIGSNSSVYSNVIYDNGGTLPNGEPAQITLDSRLSFITEDNHVYNNTCVGGRYGIKVLTYFQNVDCLMRNNLILNNIVAGQSVRALFANKGGDNDDEYGSGNIYDNNCFGVEFGEFIQWGNLSKLYDTYTDWKTAHGESWTQIDDDIGGSDPSFTDPDGDDYTLASDSPCIDAGVNLGPPYNIALMPVSDWTDNVVTGDQVDY
jgi:hypothetical protein